MRKENNLIKSVISWEHDFMVEADHPLKASNKRFA